jgi:hypothetical protein
MSSRALHLPSPPPHEGAQRPAQQEIRHLTRERSFPSTDDASALARKLLLVLGLGSDTGTLMIDVNSGGVGGFRFHEKHKL